MIYRLSTYTKINSIVFDDITIDTTLKRLYATTDLNNYTLLYNWGANYNEIFTKFDLNINGLKIEQLMLLTYTYTHSRINVNFSIDKLPNLEKFLLKKERLEKLNKIENV